GSARRGRPPGSRPPVAEGRHLDQRTQLLALVIAVAVLAIAILLIRNRQRRGAPSGEWAISGRIGPASAAVRACRVEPPIGRTTDVRARTGRRLRPMSRTRTVECPIIVGRDDVLELLDAAVAAGAKGRGRTLFLSGQAGLGKTRLIWATVRKAEAAGIRVAAGSVAPQDHSVPLGSIREF